MPVPSFLNQVGGSVYRECGAGYGLLVGVLGFFEGRATLSAATFAAHNTQHLTWSAQQRGTGVGSTP